MALYDPIRDGFREFNRMLVDSQQWDERHARSRADDLYKRTLLESNIVQQQFQRTMQKQQMKLAVNRDVRAERQLDLAIKNQKFQHDIRNEELDMQRKNLKLNAESAGRAKAKHVLDMQILEAEAEKVTRPYTPVDVDLNGLVPDHLRENGGFMTDLNELTSGMNGSFVDSDMLVKQMTPEGGVALQMKPVDQAKFLPAIQGLIAKHNDPNLNAKTNIETLEARKTELKAVTKGLDNYNLSERAAAKRQLNKINNQIVEQYKTFRPTVARDQYLRRSQEMANAGQWYAANGFPDQAEVMQRQALALWEKGIAADSASKGQMVQVYKRNLSKDGKAVGAGKVTFDTVNETIDRRDPETGESITLSGLPDDETFVKPTEDFLSKKDQAGGGGKAAPGLMTENQMKNISPLYETEGIANLITSGAAKPKVSQMKTIISRVHRRMGQKPEDRSFVQSEVVQKVEELELGYWDNVDKLSKTKPRDVRAAMTALGLKPVKGRSNKNLIEDYYFGQFEAALRAVAGDDKMRIYRPNKTTRKMAMGLSN